VRNTKYKLIERVAPNSVIHEFYRMYDSNALAPLPHDPAMTPDPHEQVDLMPLQPTWSEDEWQSYKDLRKKLAEYPALKVG
jgi:hypothetical protein